MVVHNVITDAVAKAIVNVACWSVPHELTSELQRQILQMQINIGEVRFAGRVPSTACPTPLGPSTSPSGSRT
jgi:hypothetical protein